MKYYKSIFLLLIASLFLSGISKQNRYTNSATGNKWSETVGGSGGSSLSAYDVRFTFTGYTSFFGNLSDCPVRSNGTVKLYGQLEGAENVSATDDIMYTGTLQLDIDIDICSAKGEGENAKQCSITVTGSGPVKTELEIYYDGRGGYIKIKDTTSRGFQKNAVGTCDLAQIAEERTMIPLKTIANIFNGLDLPMLTQRTIPVGRKVSKTEDGELVLEVKRVVR